MKSKIALCCIVKQENLYLRDWVKYYKDLNFDNIILYDNNDINGEYPQQVIGDYISNGFVIYKNTRGKHRYQLKAYTECYEEYKNSFEWIAFFDADEFLHLNHYKNIADFLCQECFENCDAINFSWLQYGDNEQLHYENKPVWERFTTFMVPLTNNNYKVILRGKEGTRIDFTDANAYRYSISGKNYISKTPNGEETNDVWHNADYSEAYLKHYCTLSIEEFLYRRFGRQGYADENNNYTKDIVMKVFTDLNKITPQKEKIINDFFSTFEVKEDYL